MYLTTIPDEVTVPTSSVNIKNLALHVNEMPKLQKNSKILYSKIS